MTPSQKLSQKNTEKYPHKSLTYQVIGVVFDVFKDIGFGYQEKYYQRAIVFRLDELKIPYQRERMNRLYFMGHIIGRYYVDFVIDGKVTKPTSSRLLVTFGQQG